MRAGDPLGQHHDDWIAADVGPSPGDLALRIERDAVGGGIARLGSGWGEPRFPRIGLVGAIGVGRGLGVFTAGHTADEPGAAAELLVQALEQPRHPVLGGPPPAAENAAVDARVHVADYVRFHTPVAHRRVCALNSQGGPP
jgi:hypothetical protein